VLSLQVSAGGAPVAGLTADDLHVQLDGRALSTGTVTAMPDGSYRVPLGAPLGAGSHGLRVEVDTAMASGQADGTIGCPGSARRRLRSGN